MFEKVFSYLNRKCVAIKTMFWVLKKSMNTSQLKKSLFIKHFNRHCQDQEENVVYVLSPHIFVVSPLVKCIEQLPQRLERFALVERSFKFMLTKHQTMFLLFLWNFSQKELVNVFDVWIFMNHWQLKGSCYEEFYTHLIIFKIHIMLRGGRRWKRT